MRILRMVTMTGLLTVLVFAVVHNLEAGTPRAKHPDFAAQIVTMSSMRTIVQHISQYMTEHRGAAPETLESLRVAYELPETVFRDGWERPFSYFTTGPSYVLASFGKSGRPGSQRAMPGGVLQVTDYESAIVVVNGDWAQTPWNVDR